MTAHNFTFNPSKRNAERELEKRRKNRENETGTKGE